MLAEVPLAPAGLPRQAAPPADRQVLSLTGRSFVPEAAQMRQLPRMSSSAAYNLYNIPSPRRGGRDRYDVNGNHNQVIIPKIEVGLDVRTTVSPSPFPCCCH